MVLLPVIQPVILGQLRAALDSIGGREEYYLLMEDGSYLLLEDGSRIILEG